MADRTLILGTAGHIDHGKTALVQALTGIDTDRLAEEKQRGISIDLGFAHLDLDGVRLGIVDVPGHERFIKNMLAGAAGIDLALLVVAADDSVMPQTREHLAILELLKVRRGVIALTKTDLAEPSWVDLVEGEVRELVAGTFLADATIVRTSAQDGTGLDELRHTLADAAASVTRTHADRPFRMSVDRAFTLAGLGTVVTGTVSSGRVALGDEVAWHPAGKRVRVRGIQSHGSDAEVAAGGQRAALNLAGVHHTETARGDMLATPGSLVPSNRLTVRVSLLADSPWPLKHRARVRVYLGTQEVIARVTLLQANTLRPGESGLAQLLCAEPVVAVGRQPFVLRAESPLWTIGGGTVLQADARRIARKDHAVIERLDALDDEDPGVRTSAVLYFRGTAPVTPLDVCRDADVDLEHAGRVLDELGSLGLHPDVADDLHRRITEALERLHDEMPLHPRVPTPTLVHKLHVDRVIVTRVVRAMIDAGVLAGDESGVALAGFEPKLTSTQRDLHSRIVDTYDTAGLTPPALPELGRTLGSNETHLRPLLDLCVGRGELVHLGDGLYLAHEHERNVRDRLSESLRDGDGMTVSEIKDTLGVSRKYAVPLVEYLDRVGFTRRVNDKRVLA